MPNMRNEKIKCRPLTRLWLQVRRCLQHKLPLVNKCTQPRILEVWKLQFVAKQRIRLNKLLKFNQHNRSCRLCISILGQLLILPVDINTINSRWTKKWVTLVNLIIKLLIYIYLKFSKVRSWVISLKSSSLNDAKTLRSLTRTSTALGRSFLTNIVTLEYYFGKQCKTIED